MKSIPIDEAKDGDVVAADLTGSTGSLILSAGTRLTASMIVRLRKIGITHVSVQGRDSAAGSADQDLQAALLEDRFRRTDDHPFFQEMKRIVRQHLQNG